jgi:hypothetical protein
MTADRFMLEKQKTYKKVFDLACEELRTSDIEDRLRKAHVEYKPEKDHYLVECPFFDETILIEIPRCDFHSKSGGNITLVTKIMLLHYLLRASGDPVGGEEKIPYDDVPGCRSYLSVFERRTVRPLITAFGFNREAFREAGRALGATEETYGDASFTIKAFPMVPITFILWEGDEEFQPSMRILFDPSIDRYLPLEDITVVSKLAAVRILKAARKTYNED